MGFALPARILGRAEWDATALAGERTGRVEAVGLEAADLDGVGKKATRRTVCEDRTTGIEDAGEVDKGIIAGRGREELIGRAGAKENTEFDKFGRAFLVLTMHLVVSLAVFSLEFGEVGQNHRCYGPCWFGQSLNSVGSMVPSVEHG